MQRSSFDFRNEASENIQVTISLECSAESLSRKLVRNLTFARSFDCVISSIRLRSFSSSHTASSSDGIIVPCSAVIIAHCGAKHAKLVRAIILDYHAPKGDLSPCSSLSPHLSRVKSRRGSQTFVLRRDLRQAFPLNHPRRREGNALGRRESHLDLRRMGSQGRLKTLGQSYKGTLANTRFAFSRKHRTARTLPLIFFADHHGARGFGERERERAATLLLSRGNSASGQVVNCRLIYLPPSPFAKLFVRARARTRVRSTSVLLCLRSERTYTMLKRHL